MHPLVSYVSEHNISRYDDLLADPGFMEHSKFQSMMPTLFLWSNALDSQLQRAFAMSVPMATVLDERVVDGPGEPVKRRGWIARKAGNCEYTGLVQLLEKSWGITTKEQLLDNIHALLKYPDEHELVFDTVRAELQAIVDKPLAQRAEVAEKLRPAMVAKTVEMGLRDESYVDRQIQPWLEDEADFALPPTLPNTLLAWNMKRLSILAWAGARIGMVTVDEVELPMRDAVVRVQRAYPTWKDFHDAYHVARRIWIGNTEANYDDQIIGAWLLRHGDSPWVRMELRDYLDGDKPATTGKSGTPGIATGDE